MKKSLFLCLLLFLAPFLSAEELKFVTVLSSPVGTFNKLEAVDTSVPAKSPTINFCTSIGTGGTVALKGNATPKMTTLNLSQNTILGRADEGSYVLNQITMKSGGRLKGSRLLASTMQVNYKTAGKSDKLYTDTLTVAGAKAGKLNVNNGESQITESYSDPGMIWSNEYQTDGACGTQAQCAKQYLLKQRSGGTVVPPEPDGEIECTNSDRGPCGGADYYWNTVPLCDDINGWDKNFEGACIYFRDCTKSESSIQYASETYPPGNCRGNGEFHGGVSCCTLLNSSSERNTCGSRVSNTDVMDWAQGNTAALCSALGYQKPDYWQFEGANHPGNSCYFYYQLNSNCIRADLVCNKGVPAKQAVTRTCKRK